MPHDSCLTPASRRCGSRRGVQRFKEPFGSLRLGKKEQSESGEASGRSRALFHQPTGRTSAADLGSAAAQDDDGRAEEESKLGYCARRWLAFGVERGRTRVGGAGSKVGQREQGGADTRAASAASSSCVPPVWSRLRSAMSQQGCRSPRASDRSPRGILARTAATQRREHASITGQAVS
jgi:hypothetical protein